MAEWIQDNLQDFSKIKKNWDFIMKVFLPLTFENSGELVDIKITTEQNIETTIRETHGNIKMIGNIIKGIQKLEKTEIAMIAQKDIANINSYMEQIVTVSTEMKEDVSEFKKYLSQDYSLDINNANMILLYTAENEQQYEIYIRSHISTISFAANEITRICAEKISLMNKEGVSLVIKKLGVASNKEINELKLNKEQIISDLKLNTDAIKRDSEGNLDSIKEMKAESAEALENIKKYRSGAIILDITDTIATKKKESEKTLKLTIIFHLGVLFTFLPYSLAIFYFSSDLVGTSEYKKFYRVYNGKGINGFSLPFINNFFI